MVGEVVVDADVAVCCFVKAADGPPESRCGLSVEEI